jgi:hypothetical protein
VHGRPVGDGVAEERGADGPLAVGVAFGQGEGGGETAAEEFTTYTKLEIAGRVGIGAAGGGGGGRREMFLDPVVPGEKVVDGVRVGVLRGAAVVESHDCGVGGERDGREGGVLRARGLRKGAAGKVYDYGGGRRRAGRVVDAARALVYLEGRMCTGRHSYSSLMDPLLPTGTCTLSVCAATGTVDRARLRRVARRPVCRVVLSHGRRNSRSSPAPP